MSASPFGLYSSTITAVADQNGKSYAQDLLIKQAHCTPRLGGQHWVSFELVETSC